MRQVRGSPRLAPEGSAQQVWDACVTLVTACLCTQCGLSQSGDVEDGRWPFWDCVSHPGVEDGLMTVGAIPVDRHSLPEQAETAEIQKQADNEEFPGTAARGPKQTVLVAGGGERSSKNPRSEPLGAWPRGLLPLLSGSGARLRSCAGWPVGGAPTQVTCPERRTKDSIYSLETESGSQCFFRGTCPASVSMLLGTSARRAGCGASGWVAAGAGCLSHS